MGCDISTTGTATAVDLSLQRRSTSRVTRAYAVPTSPQMQSVPQQPQRFLVGDIVKIIGNTTALQRLQQGHGGYNRQMMTTAGKTGRVVGVDADGDLKVEVEGKQWLFNPQCCSLDRAAQSRQQLTGQQAGPSGDDDDDDDDVSAAAYAFGLLLGNLMANPLMAQQHQPTMLVKEALEGNVDNVRALLQRYPNQVNTKLNDITALQAASYKGFRQIVEILLQAGAKPEITDKEGNTSIHYAVEGNEPIILDMLLLTALGSINHVNRRKRTALHAAAWKEFQDCVKVLLKYNCDVNVQDFQGDTALHDALSQNNVLITVLLVETKKVNLALKNTKGFNAIHMASQVGSHLVLGRMLSMAPRLVNEKLPNCSTALHLAAVSGSVLTVNVLVGVGRANLEIANSQSHTALTSAIATGQLPVIEFLTEKGANLECEDSDGDTPLHIVIILMRNIRVATSLVGLLVKAMFEVQPKSITQAPRIHRFFELLNGPSSQGSHATILQWLAVACFLVASGADLHHKNRQNKSPLDEVAENDGIVQLLLRCQKLKMRQQAPDVLVVGQCAMQ